MLDRPNRGLTGTDDVQWRCTGAAKPGPRLKKDWGEDWAEWLGGWRAKSNARRWSGRGQCWIAGCGLGAGSHPSKNAGAKLWGGWLGVWLLAASGAKPLETSARCKAATSETDILLAASGSSGVGAHCAWAKRNFCSAWRNRETFRFTQADASEASESSGRVPVKRACIKAANFPTWFGKPGA